jgi:membrane protease YdiL (CAAX protease family)
MNEEPRSLSFFGAAVWTIGAALLLNVAVAFTEAARPGALGDLVSVTLCHVLSYSVVIFAMLRLYAPETPVREVVAFRMVPFSSVALAVAAGACIYPALSVVDRIMERRFPVPTEQLELVGKLMATGTVAQRAVLGASFLFAMPIAEEVFFRGVVFTGLRRERNAGWVILGTAVYFAAAHGDVRSFASAFALGILLGWLRDRTGSIVPTVLTQTAFFAVPVIPILRGRDPMLDEIYPTAWVVGGLAIAAVSCALLEWRHRRSADS